ncbi:hypothetical protein DY000_02032208 [Brassica cretica]|uniref:SRCR domain-containing protein n=1 Tax=Brassica cretica TaxID=69181 RepID=A0ABQ7DU57_BRACR|nr:hypothetical protein DY000_02032208 [Brassica cretica]
MSQPAWELSVYMGKRETSRASSFCKAIGSEVQRARSKRYGAKRLQNGEAQCAGKRSEAAPENICNLEDGYLRGKCDNEDGEIVCNSYDCEA